MGLPSWLDGTAVKAIAAMLAVALLLGAYMAYTALRGPAKVPSKVPAAPGYTGPVTWHGQKDVYERLRKLASCVPNEIPKIDQTFRGSLTPPGRLKVITQGVEKLRGHNFASVPTIRFLENDSFDAKLGRMIAREVDMAALDIDARVLVELGALESTSDLTDLTRSGASAIAGFYTPDEERIYVRKGTGAFKKIEELVLAHEIELALADAVFDWPLSKKTAPAGADAALAARALVEGDATLTSQQYDLVLGLEMPEAFRNSSAVGSAVDAGSAPYFLRRSFGFPYVEGALFVCEVYALGGWEGVDRLYSRPPTTTADILFPDRYVFHIEPEDPEDPPKLGARWKKQPVRSFGAADLLWLFQAPGGTLVERDLRDASSVRRWNGGEIHSWTRGDDIALTVGLVDGGEKKRRGRPSPTLCARMRQWLGRAFPGMTKVSSKGGTQAWRDGDDYRVLSCSKRGPRLAIAPDLATARKLAR